METNRLRNSQRLWVCMLVGQIKGRRRRNRKRKVSLMIISALFVVLTYGISLLGCANAPTTYDYSLEDRMNSKHDRGGRGRGGGNGGGD